MFFRHRRPPHHRPDLRQARWGDPPIDGALQGVGRSGDRVNLLELAAVEVGYHGEPVLPPVNLAISAGVAVGIVGPNGSGKTTLVRTMLGLLKPIRGAVKFPSGKRPRFGYVPQRASVDVSFPLTAYEVALMGRYGLTGPGRRPTANDAERTKAALADVGAL